MKTPKKLTADEFFVAVQSFLADQCSTLQTTDLVCKKCKSRIITKPSLVLLHEADLAQCVELHCVLPMKIPYCPLCEFTPSSEGCIHVRSAPAFLEMCGRHKGVGKLIWSGDVPSLRYEHVMRYVDIVESIQAQPGEMNILQFTCTSCCATKAIFYGTKVRRFEIDSNILTQHRMASPQCSATMADIIFTWYVVPEESWQSFMQGEFLARLEPLTWHSLKLKVRRLWQYYFHRNPESRQVTADPAKPARHQTGSR